MSKMLSNPAMLLWVILITTPLFWSLGPEYEGRILPVVSNIEITEIQTDKNGSYIFVSFDKTRQCEFIGLSWYDKFNIRHGVEFSPNLSTTPKTRPIGGQAAGPWLIKGLENIEGSRAVTTHRCHPLWLTYTQFYP